MVHIAGNVTIDAPAHVVFDMVADERNEPAYNRRIVRAEKVTPGAVGQGTRFVAEPKGLGSRGEMTMEILGYDRPHRLHTVVRSSVMEVQGSVTFDEVAGGTRLAWDWHLRLLGALRVLTPVLVLVGPRWERANWLALKDHLEARRR